MISTSQIRSVCLAAALLFLHTRPSHPQDKPQPQVSIDLRALGAAADLFADKSDSKYQQRGTMSLFWLGEDRLVVAFSTTPRWTDSGKVVALRVRMLVFDRKGDKRNEREWNFGAEGSESDATLDLAPGPENSILAVHASNAAGKIPEGDFIQVLNPDATLRQDLYVPATGAWVPSVLAQPALIVETYYANKHSSFAWWSGQPLKSGASLDLPPHRDDTEVTTAGPGVAARADCLTVHLCSGIRVFGPGKTVWSYAIPSPEMVPVPLVFLSPSALLIALYDSDSNKSQLVVGRPNASEAILQAIPRGNQVTAVTGVTADGHRVSLGTAGEAGLCGTFGFWCRQRSEVLVLDVVSKQILFEQEISPNGALSAISPDGRLLALFDRNRLTLYPLP